MSAADRDPSPDNRTPFLQQHSSSSAPPRYDQIEQTTEKSPAKERLSQNTKDFAAIGFLPTLNVITTTIFVGILIYGYQAADHKTVEFTIASMRIPTFISLFMALIKMCIAGGIGYALSEYKWIRLQEGTKLSTLEVYDASSRGIGGILRVLTAIRPDRVLLPLIILQLGLIAMGPASQEVLTVAPYTWCTNATDVIFTDLRTDDVSMGFEDIRSFRGLQANYLLQFAFELASRNFVPPMNMNCPDDSESCSYYDIPLIVTVPNCVEASFDTVEIISGQDRNLIVPYTTYINYTETLSYQLAAAPAAYYAPSMLHRTGYDANNFTYANASAVPNPSDYAGDQQFVFITRDNKAAGTTSLRSADAKVYNCTLQSYFNMTYIQNNATSMLQAQVSSRPIEMDYAKLADPSYWKGNVSEEDRIMRNAYAMQVSFINYLVLSDQSTFRNDIAGTWSIYVGPKSPDTNTAIDLLDSLLTYMAIMVVHSRPESRRQVKGEACYRLPEVYQLDPRRYYPVCLVLLIPMVWWVAVYCLSLKRLGVSRGHSQVALLVTGFTTALKKRFKGYSHADSNRIFEKAKTVDVVFGESKSRHGRRGHAAFGEPNELQRIPGRRPSLPRI
ncbi:hypothetical protein BCR43DRAFT_521167 [Syncephalastrum racemosum]|uniref:Uncharacterized protein n=1 Tax=Syncephalastrum racemosum TaxID=13706 RepID=A0A1X2HL19_SYNRA|nr:hypothetical protein BCR43DRAFT_521167 [Syncephalastrum racemosum]